MVSAAVIPQGADTTREALKCEHAEDENKSATGFVLRLLNQRFLQVVRRVWHWPVIFASMESTSMRLLRPSDLQLRLARSVCSHAVARFSGGSVH
jgi:hypothetical protein